MAVLAPIVFMASGADRNSFSLYWGTAAEPWFILTVASTSFYMFQSERWRPAAVFALVITAFNAYQWPVTHNVAAVLFFVACWYAIAVGPRRLRAVYLAPYTLSMVGVAWSYFAVEVLMTYVLVAYHVHLYAIERSINKR